MTSMRFLGFKMSVNENWNRVEGVQINAMLETIFGEVIRVHIVRLSI
jgi:hypothetical protein